MDLENYLEQYDSQVQEVIVKEIMHYEILDGLFSIKDIHNSLVFQGGTSLRLCYNNDRYSEDLDFVMNKNQTFDRDFMKYFENVFKEKILNKYNLEAEIDTRKVNNDTIQRWTAKLFIPIFNRKSRVNIEIANIPSHSHHSLPLINNHQQLFSMNLFAEVETLNEIFADKVIALAYRPYIKFRDLWDIDWLMRMKKLQLDYELVNLKIQDYHNDIKSFVIGLNIRKNELKQANIELEFQKEMMRFLDKDYFDKIIQFNHFNTIKENIETIINESISYFNELINNIELSNPDDDTPPPPSQGQGQRKSHKK